MPHSDEIIRAAEYQAARHLAREPLDLMRQPFAPQTIADAYAVQELLVERLAAARGPAAGYKVAYTSAVMRRLATSMRATLTRRQRRAAVRQAART